jgi:hypothetical protein
VVIAEIHNALGVTARGVSDVMTAVRDGLIVIAPPVPCQGMNASEGSIETSSIGTSSYRNRAWAAPISTSAVLRPVPEGAVLEAGRRAKTLVNE